METVTISKKEYESLLNNKKILESLIEALSFEEESAMEEVEAINKIDYDKMSSARATIVRANRRKLEFLYIISEEFKSIAKIRGADMSMYPRINKKSMK